MIAAELEEIVGLGHPFNELRVLSSILAGWVSGKPDVVEDLERVIGGEGTAITCAWGCPPDTGAAELSEAAGRPCSAGSAGRRNPLTGHEMVLAARSRCARRRASLPS